MSRRRSLWLLFGGAFIGTWLCGCDVDSTVSARREERLEKKLDELTRKLEELQKQLAEKVPGKEDTAKTLQPPAPHFPDDTQPAVAPTFTWDRSLVACSPEVESISLTTLKSDAVTDPLNLSIFEVLPLLHHGPGSIQQLIRDSRVAKAEREEMFKYFGSFR